MIRPLVVGNWKMNPQTATMAARLAAEIKKGIQKQNDVDVVIAPPTLYLSAVHKIRSGSAVFELGAQNAHEEKLGAHTGEISLTMLRSFDVQYVILGHSERRAAGETDAEVNKKVRAAVKDHMTAIVCVGETKRDQNAHYLNVIENQIREACAGVSKEKLKNFIVAYEPVWAIGTGKTATPEDVHEMKLFIQKVLTDIYGRNIATKVRVIYGGSVNGKNAEILMKEGMVDGFLVGGASIRPSEFIEIVKAAA